ncbi:MAG: DUF1361 domain-containing protein [Verrucomicrobiaceae bacterium]|nr:DUF1361 domain-containing protein [Verrucomicrobiaceae bacterium]
MNRTRALLLILSFLWCVALLAARHVVFGQVSYGFLIWNMFLAALPLALSTAMVRTTVWLALPVFPVWLLLFPNAPYVLTDLFHLRPKAPVPLWFDLLLLLSSGGLSLFMGLVSMRQVHGLVTRGFGALTGWLVVIVSMFATGFGIYLGRFLRWNSWDVLTHPRALGSDIAGRLLHPLRHSEVYAVTAGFGALLVLAYALFVTEADAARREH